MSVAAAQTEPTENNQELQRLLRDSAASFARRGGVTRARHLRKTKPGIDPDIWSQLAGQGWLGILIPESFGGQGLGFAEMAVVAEELARTLAPSRWSAPASSQPA
ncbi:MAG: acyl-CoA dehydrogenase family protein [Xanthobacteraceae bacterium]